jgi:hypothetical protein
MLRSPVIVTHRYYTKGALAGASLIIDEDLEVDIDDDEDEEDLLGFRTTRRH